MYMATAEDDPGSCTGFAKKPLPRYEPLGAPPWPASGPAADPNTCHNPVQVPASIADKVAARPLPADAAGGPAPFAAPVEGNEGRGGLAAAEPPISSLWTAMRYSAA